MVKLAKKLEMPALALTDHGVMFGIIDFYERCIAEGIKPILGCEIYVSPRKMTDRDPKKDNKQYHLVLLAENLDGYKNLLKICSAGWTEGFYYKPRVDKDFLSRHSSGLIAATACLGGEVPEMITQNNYNGALKAFSEYREIFGKDNVYIELQDHDLPEQKPVNEVLVRIAEETGAKLICTNDSHYLKREDAAAHDVLLCIQTGATVDDPKRIRFGSEEFYFKSAKEMAKRFSKYSGAMENTVEIAERCNVELDFSRSQMPEPEIPDGLTADQYLEDLSWRGLEERYHNPSEEIKERMRMELDVIKTMGFPKYFLIVRDFAKFSRDQGICIGVRGSAAGSIVAYGLGVTDVDPIEYALPFERFLNIERVSMPDIDMDFQDDRRDEVIKYVSEKYGADHVSQIITFGTFGAKAAVRDCGRVLGIPLSVVDRICKLIPSVPVGISIDRAKDESTEFSDLYKDDGQVRKLINVAKQLEGISRHSSVHAAGVIISGDSLVESCPVIRGAKGEVVSQFDAHGLEMVGLLKMDFLGLANLTILSKCIENIRQNRGIDIDILKIPLDDAKSFEMLGRGDTTGVFQLESAGMRQYIQDLKPSSVKELAAMIALYRPGPMGSIPQYIKCKNGSEEISYLHPCLEPILKDSYGVVVYQDDVMYIARAVAGFTLGQADILRRAMGKKKKQEMEKMKANFFEGAAKNGIPKKTAQAIFNLIEPFAGYGFNKAHAVCYAHVAYQTAYLKANYPVEYFAAMLATHVDNKEKVALYIEEARRLKIEVLPPDINLSEADFCVQDGAIRFGLAAIKNCGKALVDAVVEVRKSGGPFKSLQDFCVRVMENTQIGKSAIETLTKAGALTSLIPSRKLALEMLESTISRAQSIIRDKTNGQTALFGGFTETDQSNAVDDSVYLGGEAEDFPKEDLLAMERELLGLYVSDHPLKGFREVLQSRVNVTSDKIQDLTDQEECIIGGLITDVRNHTTKKNHERMAFIKIEDLAGPISVTVFPSVFKECASNIVLDKVVVIKGKASHRERLISAVEDDKFYHVEVIAESITEIKNGARSKHRSVNAEAESWPEETVDPALLAVHIRLNRDQRDQLPGLKSVINAHPGSLPVSIHVPKNGDFRQVCTDCCVTPSAQFFSAVCGILGAQSVWTEQELDSSSS